MKVTVRYVDGVKVTGSPDAWPQLRADGIDHVDILGHRLQGFTLYWLYPADGGWVAGGYGPDPPIEVLFGQTDDVTIRRPVHPPDLVHRQVKLGWWLPEDGD